MARMCDICGKGPQVANLVSNANNRVKRWVYPNIQTLRYTTAQLQGEVCRGGVCAKCVKGGKIKKII